MLRGGPLVSEGRIDVTRTCVASSLCARLEAWCTKTQKARVTSHRSPVNPYSSPSTRRSHLGKNYSGQAFSAGHWFVLGKDSCLDGWRECVQGRTGWVFGVYEGDISRRMRWSGCLDRRQGWNGGKWFHKHAIPTPTRLPPYVPPPRTNLHHHATQEMANLRVSIWAGCTLALRYRTGICPPGSAHRPMPWDGCRRDRELLL